MPSGKFEYHISLHHSQTDTTPNTTAKPFEYHISLHHSQTRHLQQMVTAKFEYHISLHHSQTLTNARAISFCLNTIYLYIILKRECRDHSQHRGLNTIYLYIILKQWYDRRNLKRV